MKSARLILIFVAGLVALAGCSGSTGNPNAGPTRVGVAYDQNGKGDASFNDAAYAGLMRAEAQLGVEIREVYSDASATDARREELLTALVREGCNPVIAVGFGYSNALGSVAAKSPGIIFAIIDSVVEAPNVGSLVFAAEQGSYLVGVIAASASRSGHIGFIGGMDLPLIRAFEAGYSQGARSINPTIAIESRYLGPAGDNTVWSAPDKARTAAAGMIAGGTDVIYAAAGGSGLGMLQAIKEAGAGHWAIGVDSDQYNAPSLAGYRDCILTSMMKRVDVAVYGVIKGAVEGSPLVGVQNYDLAREGVGYSASNPAVAPYAAAADRAAAGIKAGTIKVTTN